jgi:hypothetical protein
MNTEPQKTGVCYVRHQYAGQDHRVKINSGFVGSVAEVKILGKIPSTSICVGVVTMVYYIGCQCSLRLNIITGIMVSPGMLRRVALVRTDVSEELSASFFRVTTIDELGTTLAVTSNRRTLLRN